MLSLSHPRPFSKSNLNIHTAHIALKVKAGELWPVYFFDAVFRAKFFFLRAISYISKFNLLPWLILFFVLARNSYRYISAKLLIFDAFAAMFLQNGMGARNSLDKIHLNFLVLQATQNSHFTLLFCRGWQRKAH